MKNIDGKKNKKILFTNKENLADKEQVEEVYGK